MKRLLILLLLLFSGCSATAAPDVDVKAFTNNPVPAELTELPGVEFVIYRLDSEKAKEFKIKKQCFIVCFPGKCIVVETLDEVRELIQ
jgi:hypothetical protein